jgi:hydroxymethylglutaryl-CoA lyase
VTRVELLEVSPRDGLQNEDVELSTEDKIALVTRMVEAGATRIEAASFVSPRRVPRMADAEAVLAGVPRSAGVRYSGLIANARGLERAAAAGVDEVNIVVVATDTFCRRNQGTTTVEACDSVADLVRRAREGGISTTVTIAAAFGCPFEGEVAPARLHEVAQHVAAAGPDEVGLADTIGVAVPADITHRVELVRAVVGDVALRLHLHDTRHLGVANAVAGVEAGVSILDASAGGIGGCPFAPGATGNVATEDLVYLFDRMGVSTGLILDRVTATTEWLEGRLGRRLPGALLHAGGFPAAGSA